jgi:SAM-dependent MidA family methyltransferase
VPDAEARRHSERVADYIRACIDVSGGEISFAEFMELALYAPALGYYAAGTTKLGPAGDFVTAPEVSALFSRSLAHQVAQTLDRLGGGEVLELGPGSGVMAADLLSELERLDCLPSAYRLLEVSPELRARQELTLDARVPQLMDRIEWLDALPAFPLRGLVLANEVLDALPVHLFCLTGGELCERVVGRKGDQFIWGERRPGPELSAAVRALGLEPALQEGPEPYCSEIRLGLGAWIGAIAKSLGQGLVLLMDYGYPRAEYYLPERSAGTLMCHYRHRAHGDPFLYPGLQDITAQVDFTAVAESAVDAGLEVAGFIDQASFLINCGLAEMLKEDMDVAARLHLAQQVKTLTLPSQMGERFKVMGLVRGMERSLRGFERGDRAARL